MDIILAMKSALSCAIIVILASMAFATPSPAMQAGVQIPGVDCSASASQKDARCFGAVGDKQTENVAAFNAWFAALAAQPGSVGILPAGDYLVDSAPKGPPTLRNANNVTIIANGAVIYQAQSVLPGGNPPEKHFATILIDRASGLTWMGGRIIGNADYTGKNQATAHASTDLEITNSNHVTIQNARMDNWGFAGILSYNSNYVTIKDNELEGPASTTLYGGGGVIPPGGNYNFAIALEYTTATDPAQYNHDIEVTGNSIVYGGDGIISGDTYRHVLIANNVIKRSIGQHGMYIDGLTDATISNNDVQNPYIDGIKTNPNRPGSNVLFSNNSVTVTDPGMGTGACVTITNSVDQSRWPMAPRYSNLTVLGGTYSGCSGYGIYASLVDGLHINNVKISDIKGPGIVAYYITGGDISGNTIDTTGRAAIVIRPAPGGHVDVKNNTILNPNLQHSGVPLFDSAISVSPWTKGQNVTADISGTRITRGNGRPDSGVLLDDTAAKGTTLGTTEPNNLGGLKVNSHRSPQ